MPSHNLPLVSIVTPSFNSGDFLEQAIQSVVGQGYPHLEHIVVDGGSTDNTLQILQRYDEPVRWRSEPDEGQANAINKGFGRARGAIIGWLNADDTYRPQAIEAAAGYLQAHPEIDLVYGHYHFIDAGGVVIHPHQAPPFNLERMLYGDAIIPQTSMFFRRHVIRQTGGVRPDLHYVMDWEFAFRIARHYRVARVDQAWANFRIVEGTKSVRQSEKFWPEIIVVLQEVVREGDPRLLLQANDALFMSHLRAGLEFARSGQLATAQEYIAEAFNLCPHPAQHPAVLASGLFQTATYPWHSAFQPHPQAQVALANLSTCLGQGTVQRRVRGYLHLYQALRRLRQGRRPRLGQVRLAHRDFLQWPALRMMLAALLKPAP